MLKIKRFTELERSKSVPIHPILRYLIMNTVCNNETVHEVLLCLVNFETEHTVRTWRKFGIIKTTMIHNYAIFHHVCSFLSEANIFADKCNYN